MSLNSSNNSSNSSISSFGPTIYVEPSQKKTNAASPAVSSSVYEQSQKTHSLGKKVFGWFSKKMGSISPARFMRGERAQQTANASSQPFFIKRVIQKAREFFTLKGAHQQRENYFSESGPVEQHGSIRNPLAESSNYSNLRSPIRSNKPLSQTDSHLTNYKPIPNSQTDSHLTNYKPIPFEDIDHTIESLSNSDLDSEISDSDEENLSGFVSQNESVSISEKASVYSTHKSEIKEGKQEIELEPKKETDQSIIEKQRLVETPVQQIAEKHVHFYSDETHQYKELLSELADYRVGVIKTLIDDFTSNDHILVENIRDRLTESMNDKGLAENTTQQLVEYIIKGFNADPQEAAQLDKDIEEVLSTVTINNSDIREKIKQYKNDVREIEDDLWKRIEFALGPNKPNELARLKAILGDKRLNLSGAFEKLQLYVSSLKTEEMGREVFNQIKSDKVLMHGVRFLPPTRGIEVFNLTDSIVIKKSGKIYLKTKALGQGGYKVATKMVLIGIADTGGKNVKKIEKMMSSPLAKKVYLPTEVKGDQEAEIHSFLIDQLKKKKSEKGKDFDKFADNEVSNIFIGHSVSLVAAKNQTGIVEKNGVLAPLRGGDINSLFQKPEWKKLSLAQKLDVVRQMANGVRQLNSLGIIHRDLNTGNFLFNFNEKNQLMIEVTDYGKSSFITGTDRFITEALPMSHFAPELLGRKKDLFSVKGDVFQLGISIYQVLSETSMKKLDQERQAFFKKLTPDLRRSFIDKVDMFASKSDDFKNQVINNPPPLFLPVPDSNDTPEIKAAKEVQVYAHFLANAIWKSDVANWPGMASIPEPVRKPLLESLSFDPDSRPSVEKLTKDLESLMQQEKQNLSVK